MIQDNQCNRVFFSALLRECSPIAFRGLTEVLNKYEVPWSFLEGTNDIWCRDYMPIQILPNQFMGYDYHPDYLLHSAKDRATITDGNEICRKLGYACSNMLSTVKIDGGNVVKADGRAIMTSKILRRIRVIICLGLSIISRALLEQGLSSCLGMQTKNSVTRTESACILVETGSC